MLDLASMPPENVRALAEAAASNSDFEGAERALRELVRRSPRDLSVLFRLVRVLQAQGARHDALSVSRKIVGLAPKVWQAQACLASALGSIGQLEASDRAFEMSMALGANEPDFFAAYGATLERLRKTEKARELAQRAVQMDPRNGPGLNLLGQLAIVDGDDVAAEEWLNRAIRDSTQQEARATGWHRLGALREKQKRWDEAFQCHDRANRVLLNTAPARHMLAESVFDHLPHLFLDGCEPTLAKWAAREFTKGPPDPVFLVGFPRSGTTMTENVLGALPGTITTDEEPVLSSTMQLALRMCGNPQFPDTIPALDTLTMSQLEELRAEYWRSVSRLVSPDAPKAPLLVDKAPLRFIHSVFLSLLFPKSRMIFVVRDPRDCCLSCFFQDFAISASLVRFLALETTGDTYAEVMNFWFRARTKIRIPYLEMRYEDLVTDFEPNARKLVEFIGRQWSDDILRFNEKAGGRAIRTPSYRSVTEKVNTRAIGKWSKYESHLGPLIERVRPFLEPLGYEE